MTLDYLAREGITSSRVLEAMAAVPRDRFVPRASRAEAYANHPLPIGRGQTISQPFIVAYMTQELDVRAGERVLEVGTGSGYQSAVLAALDAEVYTVEIIAELAERARGVLADLGYDRVHVRTGNGRLGWPEHAPFDAVIVTAADESIPGPLVDQLAPGGRLIMPVGRSADVQELILVRKGPAGRVDRRVLLPVRFVPLTGADA